MVSVDPIAHLAGSAAAAEAIGQQYPRELRAIRLAIADRVNELQQPKGG